MVHLGGDEVPHAALTKSPACDRFIAQRPEWSGKLKLYFTLRAGHIASRLGLQLLAWDDGLLDASGTAPVPLTKWNVTDMYVDVWNNVNSPDRAFLYANEGYKVRKVKRLIKILIVITYRYVVPVCTKTSRAVRPPFHQTVFFFSSFLSYW